MYYNFFNLSEKEGLTNLKKVAAAKIFFSSVHVTEITCFDEYFVFHVITGKYCFYQRLSSL